MRGWWDNDGWQPRQLCRRGRMLWSCSGILCHVSPSLLLQPFTYSHIRLSSFCLLFLIALFPTREASHGLPEWISVEVSNVIIWFSTITTHPNNDLGKFKRLHVFNMGKSKRYWTTRPGATWLWEKPQSAVIQWDTRVHLQKVTMLLFSSLPFILRGEIWNIIVA